MAGENFLLLAKSRTYSQGEVVLARATRWMRTCVTAPGIPLPPSRVQSHHTGMRVSCAPTVSDHVYTVRAPGDKIRRHSTPKMGTFTSQNPSLVVP